MDYEEDRISDQLASDCEELRLAIAVDLCSIGKSLLALKEEDYRKLFDGLMPGWKISRFIRSISTAGDEVLKAMDCLTWKDAPTTETLIESVLARWKSAPEKEKAEIVSKFRVAFTVKSETKNAKPNASKTETPGVDPKAATTA